jgi:hypothetical protein
MKFILALQISGMIIAIYNLIKDGSFGAFYEHCKEDPEASIFSLLVLILVWPLNFWYDWKEIDYE